MDFLHTEVHNKFLKMPFPFLYIQIKSNLTSWNLGIADT